MPEAALVRRFGPIKTDVAVVGQGTWYLERSPRNAGIAALRRGLDLGMTHIDTAELYGSGAAEEIVGEA
ncbi:MAG TPA: aldo/keto reductase, partial [Bauldia sp.]|nr:aldo/keto reductase [Bauldia sp.]